MIHEHPEALEYQAATPELERAATPAKLRRAALRYEVRAVWIESPGYCCSQPVQYFDRASLNERAPNNFAVYEVGGGHVEDYAERGAAQIHADQLNGCAL